MLFNWQGHIPNMLHGHMPSMGMDNQSFTVERWKVSMATSAYTNGTLPTKIQLLLTNPESEHSCAYSTFKLPPPEKKWHKHHVRAVFHQTYIITLNWNKSKKPRYIKHSVRHLKPSWLHVDYFFYPLLPFEWFWFNWFRFAMRVGCRMFKDFKNVLRVCCYREIQYILHIKRKKVQSGNEHQASPVSCWPLQSEYVATQFQHHLHFN